MTQVGLGNTVPRSNTASGVNPSPSCPPPPRPPFPGDRVANNEGRQAVDGQDFDDASVAKSAPSPELVKEFLASGQWSAEEIKSFVDAGLTPKLVAGFVKLGLQDAPMIVMLYQGGCTPDGLRDFTGSGAGDLASAALFVQEGINPTVLMGRAPTQE